MRQGWIDHNPAKPVRSPRQGRKLPHFLTTEEIGRLLAAPPADSAAGLRDRAILETLYSAGLRVGELVGINDGDVDRSDGVVRVRGKGKRERLAPLGSYALRAIDKYLGERKLASGEKAKGPETPTFVSRLGKRLTTRSVGRMLEKYIAAAGLNGRTSPHTLRDIVSLRTCSTPAADVRSVQELLGHKSITTTQIYTHVSTAGLRAAYEKAHPLAG